MHAADWLEAPGHEVPPPNGFGLVQVLVLVLVPGPHVLEQAPYAPQLVHFPLAKTHEKGRNSYCELNLFSITMPILVYIISGLPHWLQVILQNSLTFLFALLPSLFLHFLAVEEVPIADPSFELHLLFSFAHVFFNFLQLLSVVILLGNWSLQPRIQHISTKCF